MPKITIRPAEEKDILAILALYCQLDQALVDLQPEFFCTAPREDAFVRQAIQANDADYLLAEADGAVLPHRYACLADLVIDAEHRGQGIGSTLLGAAKRWARDRRLEYLELNVLAQNVPAIALYESHDFVEATRVMRCML